MALRNMFSPRVTRQSRLPADAAAAAAALPAGAAAATAPPSREAVFASKESIATFAGASAAITLVWKVVGILIPSLKGDHWVAFVTACVVGGALYLMNATDPENQARTPSDLAVGALIAVLNTCVLFSASVGVESLA